MIQQLEVLVGPSGDWHVEYHVGTDRLPLAYDDEAYLLSQGEH